MRGRSRLVVVGVTAALLAAPIALAAGAAPTAAAPRDQSNSSMCEAHSFLCSDTYRHVNYEGDYVGHDEPALSFHSNVPGSGNQSNYTLTLPRDSAVAPTQDGTGGTWNFQLHPAFWFSMVMCDPQSSPEYTHADCTPDSDTNIFDNPDPTAPDWIGHHPGSAFMEMQFYPPGWVSWPAGISCSATTWCAALNIDSYNFGDLTNVDNNADCLAQVGDEPVNFAFITKSGKAHAPAGPLDGIGAFTPNLSTDLQMNPGDVVSLAMHDTPAGFNVSVHDATTNTTGSMTASTANGFAQVQYDPTASTCSEKPYAFHPMYSTSTIHTRAEWTAHSLNVAYSDEIGHFEYCDKTHSNGRCAKPGATDPTIDRDDVACLPAEASLLVKVTGCITDFDTDFDGPSYQLDWPGTVSASNRQTVSEPVRFSSPTFNRGQQYGQVTFESNLLQLERIFGYCTTATLGDCQIPPAGSSFYPMYTSGRSASGGCEWREGGPAIPNAINKFGGTPAKFWGKPTPTFYPISATATGEFWENFTNVRKTNPCQP